MSPKRHNRVPESGIASLIEDASRDIDAESGRENAPCASFKQPVKTPVFVGHNSTDFMQRRIETLYKLKDKIPSGTENTSVPDDVLYDILAQISQLDMAVRAGILGYKDSGYAGRRGRLVSQIPVIVAQPPGTVLRVSLPPLMGRRFRGSYNLYWAVKIALEEYCANHTIDTPSSEKLLLIYKRYARNLDVCYTCDNDNWETKRVTNALSEALNYSDNAEHFSMMYTAVKGTVDYMEATIVRMQDVETHLNYILDTTPAQPLSML